jgi:hypothetical protein
LAPATPQAGDLARLIEDIGEMKLNGERARRIEAEGDAVFDISLRIEKVERTYGVGLLDGFRGGETVIGKIGETDASVRLPVSMNGTHAVGDEVAFTTKILGWKAVFRRFEFERL